MSSSSPQPSQDLLELVPDIVFEYRFVPHPGFVYVTPSVTAVVGYTPEEHYADPELGRRLVHPDDRPLLEAILGDPDESKVHHLRWLARSGEQVTTAQRLRALRDADGTLTGIVGVCRPVEAGTPSWRLAVGDLKLDLTTQRVSLDGRTERLTPRESQVLAVLGSARRAVTRREIVERLWGAYHASGERMVEVHISNLRKKLEADPHHPDRLLTVRGIGYRLADPVDAPHDDP